MRASVMHLSTRSDSSTSVLDQRQYSAKGGNITSPILLFLEEIKTVSSRFPFIALLERFDDFMKQTWDDLFLLVADMLLRSLNAEV
jgi:hypothetical protein